MFCPNCGAPVPDAGKFCVACGYQITARAQAAAVGVSSPAAAAVEQIVHRAHAAAGKLATDFRSLSYTTLFPLKSWLAEKPWTIGSIRALAFLAFYPLLLGILSDANRTDDLTSELKSSAWALGLYFAVIWGFILNRVIKPKHIERQIIFSTFAFTALIGITLIPIIKELPVISQLYAVKRSQDVGLQLLGYVFGVGIVEESIKALPLYFWFLIQKKPTTPRESAFAGVLSGLAFGIAEAVGYSIKYTNDQAAGVLTPGVFLIAQFVRMISLPLLHALWAGIVGYFIGLAAHFPGKQTSIVMLGLFSMAAVHGMYDTFSGSWFGFLLCVVSLVLFVMYVRSAEAITEQLEARLVVPASS
jgi:RsiW-degrading membrane proteinase PrsW (M82 family)